MQQFVDDRKDFAMRDELSDGGGLGQQCVEPLRAKAFEVVATEVSRIQVRLEL